jgi:predicted LPLAT superfamily acyltransferase
VSVTPAPTAQWARRAERGSPGLTRFMVWLSLTIGRRASRVIVRGIAAYFFATSATARRATREFLEQALGRPPTLRAQYRTFFDFSATIHDRVYFLKTRFDLFKIDVHGHDLFESGGGALLMGGHLGSFECMRACGRALIHRRVAMAMYGAQAQRLQRILEAIAPGSGDDIVPLGEVQSMLVLHRRLEEGALVGVLADRTFSDEATIPVTFMGRPAAFPTGPMRMAAALRQRVIFMTGLYRGGNRYELHFEPLADFTQLEGVTRAEREARVHEAVHAFARRLEHHARSAPHSWFNFFDFWGAR